MNNSFPFNGSGFIKAGNEGNPGLLWSSDLRTEPLIPIIDQQPSVAETFFSFVYTLSIVAIPLIAIIAIILLVKSIKSKNRLMKEISLDTINHIHQKTIILLILGIIGLSLPTIILSVISLVLTSNAKKLFDVDLETVKSKLNIACTLNIISIILFIIVFVIFITVIPILVFTFKISQNIAL